MINAVDLINTKHTHPFFESNINLDVVATTNLEEVVDFSDILVLGVPTKVIRQVMEEVKGLVKSPKLFINVSKGIEPETLLTVSGIADEIFTSKEMKGFVTLSGPSHAEEVIKRKLTLLVAASKNIDYAILSYFSFFCNINIENNRFVLEIKRPLTCNSGQRSLSLSI